MIGQSTILQDSIDKVTGKAKYAGDYYLPDMLHMKLRFAERPHALIQSINLEKALRVAGVISIFTAQDIPYNRYGLIIQDQPVFCDKQVRFVGDQIAAVVAETIQQAEYAASLIEVTYQGLPILSSPEGALMPEAPTLHENFPGNIAHKIHLHRGDPEAVLKMAAVVLENEYHTPMQEHAYLEPEAGIAYLEEDGKITVRTAGQSVYDDQRQIAKALNIPIERIRVIYGPVGGAFGGREDISVQIVLALATLKLGRPVKLVWNRQESILGHGKRHAMTIKHNWGADLNGKIIAAEIEILMDAGAYMYTSNSVLECLLSTCVGPYDIPNVKLDGKAVFTNNVPGAAFRGYGTPQTAFAAELQISQMADLLGIDPITIRERNCLQDHSLLPTQSSLPGNSSLPELIRSCALKSGCQKTSRGWKIPVLGDQP
ncbi:MAG: xanthine dehydrogenase family protein molybdopterin-binding subunit, partial [Anaerolineales bacterium]|nr:xanthine dehydrogenase family protein molybdopterin-binding subunit [Anaerolineales bacterium]